jgi:iron transport multicopper oxidase
MLKSLVLLAGAALPAFAFPGAVGNTIKYNWDIEWVNANPIVGPRGAARPVIGINGQWPLPTVEGTVGDVVEITINNKLVNETTGIHWHGIHQIGSSDMDGASHVTQCPVPPGSSFTYKFWLDQSGTYWYHSHTGSQYPDGLRGAFIVKDKVDPYAAKYDEEYLLTVSDWYNKQVPELLQSVFDKGNVQMRPPLPDGGLINDGKSANYPIVPGKKYKFRIVNMAALTGVFVFFEDHDFTIVEIDGVNVHEKEAKMLFITPAQRYSVIIEAKNTKTKNFGISAVFDMNPDFRNPVVPFVMNATGTLSYDAALGPAPQATVQNFNDRVEDTEIKPLVPTTLGKTDSQIHIDFSMGPDSNGVPRAYVNGKPFVSPKVPTLYSALTTGEDATNPEVYGQVNPFILKKGEVVELIVNNKHFAHHPFHLHGHHFQVCGRGAPGAGAAPDVSCGGTPMERDTVTIEGGSYAVLRFKADNPGVWLFHCHIEWHVPLGLSATFIEAPLTLQAELSIPQDHLAACKANCYPTKGNAGGNTVNHLDTSNYNTPEEFNDGAFFTFQECPAGNSTGGGNGTYTTSTLSTTITHTITSCPPKITNCPAHGNNTYVTTEVIPYTTTVCPVSKPTSAKPRPTFYGPPVEVVPWPDFLSHATYTKTATYTATISGKPVVKTGQIEVTEAVPISHVYPTYNGGAPGAPKPTGAPVPPPGLGGKPVTAGASRSVAGFSLAAVAGLLVAALL